MFKHRKFVFYLQFIGILLLVELKVNAIDSLAIQENTLGICTMNGVIESSATGYTGEGYINADPGINTGVSWSFNVTVDGTYKMLWRYAFGGTDTTSRDGGLYLNNVLIDTVSFKYSGSTSWSVWQLTDTISLELQTGINTVRLGALTAKGLSNLDYFVVFGSGLSMSECLPSFPFSVASNDTSMGTVSFTPDQYLYDLGTEITATATAKPGYFFHSWSGVESDTASVFTFHIKQKTDLTALFYPDGTMADPDANCYASVQHDNGTPYLLTGGSLGETVEPRTLNELETYLSSPDPLVINISRYFQGTGEFSVRSNKSIIGINDAAHIEGVKLSIANCRNIIIKNVSFSKVVTIDEIEINGATNIWIDHCEFFTDRDHDKDFYDGLLDIKNASSFITISWCNFHDHFKSILISSGDDSYQDSVQRITFHHNYFHDCGSRLPSIRFGKSHIFSNYYENNDGAINTRVGACVKVEHNYFKNTSGAIGQTGEAYIDMDPNTNIFVNSSYSASIPSCNLNVPYPYLHLVDSAPYLPALIPASVKVFDFTSGITTNSIQNPVVSMYPNPCHDVMNISINSEQSAEISVELLDMCGKIIRCFACKQSYNPGNIRLQYLVDDLEPGAYSCRVRVNHSVFSKIVFVL
ncbi:MAG: hypothetical protein JXB49_37020 [Bacteroidales bacterium]|nr:hypothetical protein [Bacteroidales bacterium]